MMVLGLWLGTPGCDMESASADNPGTTERMAAMPSRALSRSLDPRTEFYAAAPDDAALAQTRALLKARDLADARKLTELITTPHAVWFSSGTPAEVTKAVHQTMAAADCEHRVPVLVAYNVPYRDCAQYSGGGATDTTAYKAWIDGFAQGIGKGKAVVILEPDGLGLIPYNTTIGGVAEWCKPTVTDSLGNAISYSRRTFCSQNLPSHSAPVRRFCRCGELPIGVFCPRETPGIRLL